MTELDFVWVGPKKKPGEYFRGMETIGADLAARKYPDQRVVFWCLESQEEAFRSHFAGLPNVSVQPIESYVREKEGEDGAYYKFINILKRRAKARERSGDLATAVHEWVLMKDSFFYWAAQHTTVDTALLDATIIPDEEAVNHDNQLFKEFEGFSVPFHTSFAMDPLKDLPQPWLMLVKKDDDEAQKRFKMFFDKVHTLMGVLLEEAHFSDPHPPQMREEIIKEYSLCSSGRYPWHKGRGPFSIEAEDRLNGVAVARDIKKFFFNTHHLQDAADAPGKQPRGAWHKCVHWTFSYLKDGDLSGLEYFLELGDVDPDTALPYVKSKKEPQGHVSLERFTRRRLDEIQKVIGETRPGVEAAKIMISYETWNSDPDEQFQLSNYGTWTILNLRDALLKHPKYSALIVAIDSRPWQRWTSDILFGTNTLMRSQCELVKTAKQYGMLLAHSKKSDCLGKALGCSAPQHVLPAYLERKATSFNPGDLDCFCNTLDRLSQHIFQRQGLKPVRLSSLELTVEALTEKKESSRLSWLPMSQGAHSGIIKSMIELLIKEGPVCQQNSAQYKQAIYGQLWDVRSVFLSSRKAEMKKAISDCVEGVCSQEGAGAHVAFKGERHVQHQ